MERGAIKRDGQRLKFNLRQRLKLQPWLFLNMKVCQISYGNENVQQRFLNLNVHQNDLEGLLLKHNFLPFLSPARVGLRMDR